MKVIQKVFPSLALSAIVLTTVPVPVSAEIPGTIHQDFPMLTQAVPDGGKIVTANAWFEPVQVGYSQGSAVMRSNTPVRWQNGENLIATVPMGWQVGFQSRQGNVQMVEFVPEGQTADNWQSLLTMQVFFGGVSKSPKQFSEELTSRTRTICPGMDVSSVLTGEENGYPYALWLQICPNNPQVTQAEITLFKAIQGNDSFYVVHRAWRLAILSPSQSILIKPVELEEWGRYMRLVEVCDTRTRERSCPAIGER